MGKVITSFPFKVQIMNLILLAVIPICALSQATDSLKLLSDYQKSKEYIEKSQLDSAIQILTTTSNVCQTKGYWELFTESKIDLARLYQEKEDVDQALKNYVELIRVLSRDSLYGPLAKAYFMLAEDNTRFGLYNKAIGYFSRAGEYYDRSDSLEKVAEVLVKQSELYQILDKHELADSTLKEAINLVQEHKLKTELLTLFIMQVKVYYNLGEIEKMLSANLKIYEIYKEQNDPLKVAEILNEIGFNYAALNNFEKALTEFTASYRTSSEARSPDSIGINTLINIGTTYSSLGEYNIAIDTLKAAERYSATDKTPERLAKIQNLMAETYLKAGDFSNALLYSNRSIQNAKLSNSIMVLRDCFRTHSETLQESGDFKNGLEFYRLYVELNDSIERMAIRSRYELSEREHDATINERRAILMVTNEEIEDLEYQNLEKEFALLTAEQELQKIMQKRKLYIVIFLSLGILFLLIVMGYFAKRKDNRLLNKQKESILNINRELEMKNAELAKAMEQLKMTQRKLIDSEKMASLGQLTAGIAHEINNPVNFISSNVDPLKMNIREIMEILKTYREVSKPLASDERMKKVKALEKKYKLDYLIEETDSLLKGISEGAQRTKEIVQGLRNFSRVDKQELKEVDLHELIESTLLLLRNKYKERIQIIKKYDRNIPHIECYPGQLSQVFMNLINNAIQAIDNEGTIRIETASGEINVLIAISDDGIGMDNTILKNIFDPFYTTKEVGEGTGLGLSISYGIIQQHNGQIEVNSKPGEGSTFRIVIPIRQTGKT